MDELTGLNDLHSPKFQKFDSQNRTKPAHLPNSRRPISQEVDVAGNQLEIELKPEQQIGLDASRLTQGAIAQFNQSSLRRWLKKINSQVHQRRSIEIIKITHICQRDKSNFIDGWITSYKRGDQISGSTLQLQGWVVGRDSKAISMQIMNSSDLLAEVPINTPRPDVLKAIPCYSSACNFGYQVLLNLEPLPEQAELTLYSIFQDQRRVVAGSVQYCKYGF